MNAVRQGILYDYNELITFKSLKEKITNKLCTDNTEYLNWHGRPANAMVDELQNYFESGSFINSEVCDFLVKVISDVLDTSIYVYKRKEDGRIEMLPFCPPNPVKEVHLKFTHDNKASGGNHYDCVLLTFAYKKKEGIKQEPTSSVYSRPDVPEKFKKMKGMEDVEVIDLTLDEPEILNQDFTQDVSADVNTTGESSISQDEYQELGKGVAFPMHLFDGIDPVEVDKIPPKIDGLVRYQIKCTLKDYTQKTSDLRWFILRTSSRVGLVGKRKIGSCQGSYICENKKCSYLSTEGKPNDKHFNYLFRKKTCRSCGIFATQRKCKATKLVEFNQLTGICEVFHFGDHFCQPKEDKKGNDDFISEQIKKYPNLPPKQLQVHCVKEKVNSGDIKGAQEVTRKLADRNRVRQLRNEILEPNQNADCNSFEAVAIFKKACDVSDVFHIFKMNDSRMNTSPDFVFKTSRIAAELGLLMDQENTVRNVLMDEDAYFDGAHSRCRDFISLALWLFHTSMRKLLKLACMECRSESTETIALFFKLWNEALMAAGDKNTTYRFNPKNIMVDSAGANYGGIREVFGLQYMTNKVLSCQWHFLHVMEQSISSLAEADQEEFMRMCHSLCQKKTIAEYQLVASRLQQIASEHPPILSKLEWWHVRRWHVFEAFRNGPTHAGCNLAEVGNAAWKETGSQLSLLEAAKTDVALFLLQDQEVQLHRSSTIMVGGDGPNDLQRAALERRKQRAEATGLAEVVTSRESLRMQLEVNENPEYFIPSAKSSHKPPKNAKKGVEATAVNQNESAGGRGRGRGKGRGRGRGKRFSSLPTASELARKILEAEKVVINDSTLEQSATESASDTSISASQPVTTRRINSLRKETSRDSAQPEIESYAPRRSTRGYNPPYVTMFFEKSKYRCIGCNQWIYKKDLPHPRDLLFTLKAIRPFVNPVTQQWVHPEKNGYFHLSLACLQLHDSGIEMRSATITDDVFMRLSQQQLEFLQTQGILQHITANKRRTI